jgi:dUTP pyrophosphatase
MLKVRIKKLNYEAVIPSYAKPGDCGLDLTCVGINETDDYIEYKTGLAFEIPKGYVGLLFPRSSNSKKDLLLSNAVGIIDSGYRGEVTFRYKRIFNVALHFEDKSLYDSFNKVYECGDRVGQIVIIPYPEIVFEEVEELSKTERGDGGYGHTGN